MMVQTKAAELNCSDFIFSACRLLQHRMCRPGRHEQQASLFFCQTKKDARCSLMNGELKLLLNNKQLALRIKHGHRHL